VATVNTIVPIYLVQFCTSIFYTLDLTISFFCAQGVS